jgi:hypothetical protein
MGNDLEAIAERAIFFEIDTLTESIGDYFCAIPARVTIGLDF